MSVVYVCAVALGDAPFTARHELPGMTGHTESYPSFIFADLGSEEWHLVLVYVFLITGETGACSSC